MTAPAKWSRVGHSESTEERASINDMTSNARNTVDLLSEAAHYTKITISKLPRRGVYQVGWITDEIFPLCCYKSPNICRALYWMIHSVSIVFEGAQVALHKQRWKKYVLSGVTLFTSFCSNAEGTCELGTTWFTNGNGFRTTVKQFFCTVEIMNFQIITITNWQVYRTSSDK